MKIQNGIQLYEAGELPPYPEGLETNFKVISPYGFRVVTIKDKKFWQVGTEQDYCFSEAQRLGVRPEEITQKLRTRQGDLSGHCHSTGPQSCEGECQTPYVGFCRMGFNQNTQHYYCICS